MSACWPIQVSPTQKAVLISLADNANDDGVCWPRISQICERTCLSERAVRTAIRDLELLGLVSSSIREGRSNSYTIHTPASPAALPDQGAARGAPTPASPAPTPARGAPLTTLEPSLNLQGTVNPRDAFEQFWKAYPRRVGKGAAEKAFTKIRISDSLLKTILSAIETAKLTPAWLKDDGQFIPHPATWLNQRRWEDEIAPTPVRPPAGLEGFREMR